MKSFIAVGLGNLKGGLVWRVKKMLFEFRLTFPNKASGGAGGVTGLTIGGKMVWTIKHTEG